MEKSSISGFLHCPRVTPSRASIASLIPGSTTRGAAGHRALIAETQGGQSPGGGDGRSDSRDEAALPAPRSPPHREQLGVSSLPHAPESWLHWRERSRSTPVRGCGVGRRGERETFRAGCECAARRVPGPLPRPGPAATVANRLGPPRPRHGRGLQSRTPGRRIGYGALFLEVPVYSPRGSGSPGSLLSLAPSN